MLIGQDFEKIQIELFGIIIQEPNGVISDFLMSFVSISLGIFLIQKNKRSEFEKWWIYFFILYGVSAFLGACGHGLYYYFGVFGKFPNWITGIPIIYFIELAMISLYSDLRLKKILRTISLMKMILVYLILAVLCLTIPIQEKPQVPFLPIAFNTIFGVILSAGFIGYHFYKKEKSFGKIVIGVLIMIPSAFVFLLKINPKPWFDKNDVSHLLLTLGIIFFYLGIIQVKNNSSELIHNSTT
jgi:hypothetical protein